MKIDDIYLPFNNFSLNTDDNFKRHVDITYMLEHVSIHFGLEYKKLIENEFKYTIENFIDLITINDNIGNPIKYFINEFYISPSNLRYIYHMLLIKSKIKKWYNKKNIKILEIGRGYGGLCFYIKNVLKEYDVNYNIVDLPNVISLQEKYLKKTNTNANLISCFEINNVLEHYDVVISNYCISEISILNRFEYLNKISLLCDKEFYIWNSKNFDGLNLSKYIIEDERPQTNYDGYNKFIYSSQ